jgi:hypothetical protein
MLGARYPDIDRWATIAGRYKGAKAEKAVPFPGRRPSIRVFNKQSPVDRIGSSLRSGRLAFRARLHRRNRRLVMRIDPRDLDQDAALLERRSRTYVVITGLLLPLFAFGFIWMTW